MNTNKSLLALFALSFATAFAVAADDVPASKQDVRKLERKIDQQGVRIERKIKEASSEDAKVRDANRSDESQEHKGIKDGIATIQDNQSNQTAAIIAQGEKTRRVFVEVASGGLVLLAVGALFALRTRKGRNAKQPAPVLRDAIATKNGFTGATS